MEIKVLKSDKNKIVFLFKNTNPVLVNTLRREIISDVPTMAIRTITFVKNSSALFDEIIAHRLGLIPLEADLSGYFLAEECSCKGKGCAKCRVSVTLNSEGPITVYADDLKFKDPKVKPVYPKISIIKLLKGQELEFEAVAGLGKGKEHTKFVPGLVYYTGYPKIKVEKCDGCGECEKECPVKILEVKGKDVKVKDIEKCSLCKACEDICPKKGIFVEASDKDFIVTIESWGQLSPKEILLSALDALEKKIDEFEKEFKKA